ncbi:CDCA2 protein, partial [Oxyruncus cristatus]|nr:CDCA2 protein [Oxyruncus cristatus]
MASKKPLLSPIPEIPEVFSSVSSPDSPKADWLLSGNLLSSFVSLCSFCSFSLFYSRKTCSWLSLCLRNELFVSPQFSNIVPDAEGGFDTSEHFQPGEETACESETKESSSLIENEQLQGNLLEFLEQQAIDVHEGAQRTQCPQTGSLSGSSRRRSSSAIYFPPVEHLEITGIDLPVSSYNVEEVLSVPRSSFQPFRRRSSTSGETRVRRSMRLSKDAGSEGLAWIQLPSEVPKQPPLPAPAPKSRRRASTSILAGSENVQPREQSPSPFSALGKENEDSARHADGPCRKRRRKSAPTPPEAPWAQTQRRRITNSVNKRDRNGTKHSEEAEIPPEVTLGKVSALSDFLK